MAIKNINIRWKKTQQICTFDTDEEKRKEKEKECLYMTHSKNSYRYCNLYYVTVFGVDFRTVGYIYCSLRQ